MNTLAESLGDWLLRTSIEGTILITLVLGVILLFGRHLGPRWRVALWTIAGIKLLVPAMLPIPAGLGNWARVPVDAIGVEVPAATVEAPPSANPATIVPDLPAVLETPASPSLSAAPLSASPSGALSVAEVAAGLSLSAWLVTAWLAGAVIFLAVLIFRQQRFLSRTGGRSCRDRHLIALAREVSRELRLRRRVSVVLGPAGSTPAVYGVFQPRLLLPEDWADRFDHHGLRHILLHELEHVRFGDVLWNWAAALINALHWFNPLVWVAAARFQADRELRCDADTLSHLEANERIAYGRTLLNVQETFIAAPAAAGLAPCVRNHPALRQRIAMITRPVASRSWLNAVFTLAAAGLICFSFGSANADSERDGEGSRSREGEREGARDGERSRDGDREGDRPREGARDGEREGDRPREGSREGARDGDSEGSRSREGARDGDRPMARQGELKVTVVRDGVVIGDRKMSLVNLRQALDDSSARSAVIYAAPDTPFQNVTTVANSLKSSGIQDVRIGGTDDAGGERPMRRDGEGGPSREGARDGDRPREGARDGGPSREGARDGDRPREGARDGDRPREGARDGDRPREGARDGESGSSREGARDGEMRREGGSRDGEGGAPREGARDGDRPREGARDGEGGSSREGARDGGSASSGADDRELAKLTRIYRAYDKDGSKGVTFEEWVAMKNYELSSDQERREKGWFDEADSNGDGKITLGEWIDWKTSQ